MRDLRGKLDMAGVVVRKRSATPPQVALVLGSATFRGAVKPSLPGGAEAVGRVLFTDYLFPFEVTSVLLLAAIVGVMALTKRRA